jgi:hypothetical protein
MRQVVAALAVLLVLAVTGCGGSDTASDSASGGVVDLARLDTLRAAFNEDEGRARLLLLLSPT